MRLIGQITIFLVAVFAFTFIAAVIKHLTSLDAKFLVGWFSALTATALWPSFSWGTK